MIEGMDHIALGVSDLDERISFFTHTLGLRLGRIGTHFATGKRIAILGDEGGFKIELIEGRSESQVLEHIAYRVDDVALEHARLVMNGCKSIRGPHELAAAKAVTALVEDPSGLQIQIIKYQKDSPDLMSFDTPVR